MTTYDAAGPPASHYIAPGRFKQIYFHQTVNGGWIADLSWASNGYRTILQAEPLQHTPVSNVVDPVLSDQFAYRAILHAQPAHHIGAFVTTPALAQAKTRALVATAPIVTINITGLLSEVDINTSLVSYVVSTPVVIPDPPPVYVEGVIPVASGMIVRALSGKVIDMATPSITDGKPS